MLIRILHFRLGTLLGLFGSNTLILLICIFYLFVYGKNVYSASSQRFKAAYKAEQQTLKQHNNGQHCTNSIFFLNMQVKFRALQKERIVGGQRDLKGQALQGYSFGVSNLSIRSKDGYMDRIIGEDHLEQWW